MRRFALLVAVTAVGLAVTAVAWAAQPNPTKLTFKATGKVTKGKGSKSKPVPVGASYSLASSTSDGSRVESWKTINTGWSGVVSNGKYFPTCTVKKIAAAQSDESCPKGSEIGTGKLVSVVGPDNDFSAKGVPCDKAAKFYNAGQNKVTVYLYGPGAKCVGVGYIPPYPGTWSKAGGIGGGQFLKLPTPLYVNRSLPGVLGSTKSIVATFKKQTVKVKGKKHGYLESIGCKGKRKFKARITGDPSKIIYKESKSGAGSC